MSIIKTIKSTEYAQIHNKPLQELKDLRSIGLLSHLMSRGSNWEVRKTQLFKEFGRRAVDHAFEELEQSGYLVSIKHREGKRNAYKYLISDVPLTWATIKEHTKDIENIMEISLPSGVQNEQLKMNCSKWTAQNEHLLNKDLKNKDLKNKDKNLVNKEQEIIDKLLFEYMNKGLSKQVCMMVVSELPPMEQIKNFGAYLRGCLEHTLYRSQSKKGTATSKLEELNEVIPFFDYTKEN